MGLWKLKKNLYKLALRIHDGVLQKLYRMFLSLLKVDKNIILFECMLGRSYGCNPRAIYEKMLEKGLDKKYRIYWIRARDKHFKVPGGAKIITRNTLAHHYYMAKAGIWVFNTRQNAYFVKRKEQHYIQTWHGTPLKLLGMDKVSRYIRPISGSSQGAGIIWFRPVNIRMIYSGIALILRKNILKPAIPETTLW